MGDYRLAEVEARFAQIVWEHEPINSTELVRLCAEELGWKKSTTYTVLKKLCARGIFRNEQAVVSAVLTKEEFESEKSRSFVEDSFGGSLPSFLTAFMGKRKLSEKQAEEIKRLIDSYREE